jgi:DNA repair protein SbcD/Mre11
MKILHAADLHLDSPLRGLVEYEGAPLHDVRRATRRAFTRLIDVALEERVELVLLAGDLYDGDFKDFSTALFLVEQIARLREIDAKVVWIRGNHDAESRITRHLRLPSWATELPVTEPGTVCLENWGVAVHGQSYQTRDVTQNLALAYPAPRRDLWNIGLLHTALEGREGHQPYAPCSPAELAALGYDYWALGHVHAREIVSEDPFIVFPGNLQGRNIRETGPKGATLIDLSDRRKVELKSLVLDSVRWAKVVVSLDGVEHPDDVLERASQALGHAVLEAGDRTLACRVQLVGRTPAHRDLVASERWLNELRAFGLERGSVYVESIDVRTEGELTLEGLLGRGDPFAEALSSCLLDPQSHALRAELKEQLGAELSSLPQELVRAELEDFDAIWEESTQLLEAYLLEGGRRSEAPS